MDFDMSCIDLGMDGNQSCKSTLVDGRAWPYKQTRRDSCIIDVGGRNTMHKQRPREPTPLSPIQAS